MEKEQVRELLSSYIDGVLSEEEKQEVEKWLVEDASIREEYESLKAVVNIASNLPKMKAPANLSEKIMAEIQKPQIEIVKSEIIKPRWRIWKPLAFSLATAAMICVAVVGLVMNNKSNTHKDETGSIAKNFTPKNEVEEKLKKVNSTKPGIENIDDSVKNKADDIQEPVLVEEFAKTIAKKELNRNLKNDTADKSYDSEEDATFDMKKDFSDDSDSSVPKANKERNISDKLNKDIDTSTPEIITSKNDIADEEGKYSRAKMGAPAAKGGTSISNSRPGQYSDTQVVKQNGDVKNAEKLEKEIIKSKVANKATLEGVTGKAQFGGDKKPASHNKQIFIQNNLKDNKVDNISIQVLQNYRNTPELTEQKYWITYLKLSKEEVNELIKTKWGKNIIINGLYANKQAQQRSAQANEDSEEKQKVQNDYVLELSSAEAKEFMNFLVFLQKANTMIKERKLNQEAEQTGIEADIAQSKEVSLDSLKAQVMDKLMQQQKALELKEEPTDK